METNTTYKAAITELEKILAELRSDACDVDTLAAKTKRAAQLLADCRNRLTATERELADTLAALEAN